MPAAAPPDWQVFTQLWGEPWEGVTRLYPRDATSSSAGLVDTMLGGGHPETMGAIA